MRSARAIVGVVLLVGACTPLNTNIPRSFDLTGRWVLDETASDAPPDLDAIRKREDRKYIRGKKTSADGSAAFVVQDFPVLDATELHIEQDAASMGVRYRSEGRTGQDIYRDISWGERKRDFWMVRTGWEDGALVIRSNRGDIRGAETLTLEDRGRRLRVAVRVATDGEGVRATRVFNRR